MDNSILEQQNQKSNADSASPLSKAHIRPRAVWHTGSSYFSTTKGVTSERVGGGDRSRIKGFTKQSRRRMLYMIGKIRRDAEFPLFVTLTYPNEYPTVARAKRDLKVFTQRLKRRFPDAGAIWKLEPQERGAPHYHMLVWVEVKEMQFLGWVAQNWYEIAGQGDYNHFRFHMGWLHDSVQCVSQVNSFRGVWAYAAKYIGKTFEVAEWGSQWTGRFWGTIGRQNIPFGEEKTIELEYKDVVHIQRLQRRFMHLKKASRNGLTTFCDADQWVNTMVPWAKEQQKSANSARGPREGFPKRGGTAPQSGGVPSFGEGPGASGIIAPKFIKTGTLAGTLDWMHRNDNTRQPGLLSAVVKGEVRE